MADGLDRFFGAVARKDDEAARAFYAMRAADAQRATRANRLSRETGIPADTVERNLPEIEAQQRGRRGAAVIQGNPNLARWFGDARNSAASVDDIDGLSAVSAIIGMNPRTAPSAAREMLVKPSAVPIDRRAAMIRARAVDREAAIQAARPKSTPGSWWTGTAIGTVEGFKQAWVGANMYMADALGFEELIPEQREAYAASLDRVRAATPTGMGRTGEAVYGGLISLGQMVPSLAATVLTGPVGGLAVAGGQTGLTSYGKYRERGGTRNEALLGGTLEGAIEVATEAAPLGVVARRFGKSGTGKFLGEFLGKEMLGEQVATLGQDAVDTAIANPDATWDDYWKARPGAAFDTAVAVGIASGAVGGVHHAVRALAPVERDIQHATAGVAGAALLDNLMGGATGSKLRERDPDAFQQFVEQHTEGSPVENIYIPGEVVRSLMQSDAYDESDSSYSWMADYADEADDAAALGGDVVVPLAVASARLAGSPLWETLRDDVRLSPGGMSLREARTFETEYADAMETAGRQAAADYQAELGAEPVRRVYEDVVSQARGAGLGLNAARSIADLWASRYQSRAERTGRDAWSAYQEFAPRIVQEMPDSVVRYRAADQMDVLINSMRRGAAPKKNAGPSLLEWIAKNGGIIDRGGDIASMGGDAWHRGKPGRRKLIRESDQASMLTGGTDNTRSPDVLAQAAQEAGYLPDNIEADPRALFEAIDEELRGRPTYSEANSTTNDADVSIAEAADDLRAYLDARGIDATTASDADIKAAVDTYTAPLADGRGYDQSDSSAPRGRIDFNADGTAIIRLFEGRDLSTLLHESGHLWLEELAADARADDAGEQVLSDWRVVADWFAAEGHPIADGVIPVEAHELWARGVERYLMEGKSPSSALDRAFSAFRSWLVRIYKVALNLNANLTDDVRGVMGRLIATDDAIAAATADTESRPLFADAAAAGMTEQEFQAYRGSVDQTRTDAYNGLLKRTMDVIRRSRTASWNIERKGVRAEVEKEIRARPEFRALDLMRGVGGERIQLDRAAVVDEFGTDALAMIPKGVPPTVVAKGGVHPDILAERVGMRTGREMLQILMGVQQRENELREAGDRRSALNEAVDAQTDAIMRERYGDVLGDGSIEDEAVAAIHNDARATILATEIRALAKIGKQGTATPWRAAQAWAERTVREGTVGEQASAAALARHLRNELKAGRAAERAMLAGDIEETFQAKQRQMLNHALYRAAKGAKDEVDAIVKRLDKLAAARTLPSMDQEYLERIHDLLEAYDFKRRSAGDIRERSSFSEWVKEKEEAGEEVYVPARLRTAGDINFTKLAVADIIGLADTVQSIAHLGRLKKKILVAQEEREFDLMLTEAEAAAAGLPERALSSDRNPKRSRLRAVDAMLTKTEFLADQLDAGNPNGVFNQVLVQNATRAANEKARLQEAVLAPLAKLYLDMPADQQRRLQERVEVPEFIHPETSLPTVFSRMEILAIALNTGSESNLDKMLRGEGWSSAGVDSVLARELNEADWKFVEAVWRQIDVLWPDIKRSEEALSGVAPEKVEPRMVVTPYGTIAGGYYPVVYDPTRNQRVADNYEQDAQKLLGQMGRVISTPKGHTVERTGYAAPIMLSVEAVLLNHINRVTTRIAYGRYVRDALKFINNPRIKAIVDRKMGPEYFRNLKPWLQRQVNEASLDTNTLASLDRLFRTFRVNTTMVGLGFRLTTMLAQLGGLPNSAAQIGGKWLAVGMAEAVASAGASPRETLMGQGPARRFVFERSEEMARRAQDFDRDIATAFRDMQGQSSRLDGVRAWAFWGIGAVDVNLVAMPTWLGAYRKGLSEGMTEEQAASYGDKAVRTSQGSGRAKDLAEIQNANEGYRVLTLFYTPFNVLYNQQRQTVQAGRRGDWRKVATNAWWLAMAGPLLSAFLTGDWPQKDEDWLTWAVRKVFFGLWAGVPIVRDLAGIADRKVSGQYTKGLDGIGQLPTARAFSSGGAVGIDAFNALADTRAYTELRASFPNLPEGGELSERWVKHAIEAPGYFVGLPTGQASASAQFLYDVERDAAEPDGVADWYTGMTKGRLKEE